MIRFQDLPITEVVYTFVEHNGNATHIAVSALKSILEWRTTIRPEGWPVTHCEFGESLIAALERGDLGVEEPHALRLPESALEVPGIIGVWGDSHICIDGAHRLWRLWRRGELDFPARVVPEALWREFTIDGMPGSGEFWQNFNATAQVRTEALEALHKLLGGK